MASGSDRPKGQSSLARDDGVGRLPPVKLPHLTKSPSGQVTDQSTTAESGSGKHKNKGDNRGSRGRSGTERGVSDPKERGKEDGGNHTENRRDSKKAPPRSSSRSEDGVNRRPKTRSGTRTTSEGSRMSARSSSQDGDRSSVTSDGTQSRDQAGEGRLKKWESKEVRSLSRSVEKKLTYLVNSGNLENNFCPMGVHITTHKMMPYDVQYKILEADLDRAARRKNKQNENKNSSKSPRICPVLERQSSPVVLHSQVQRITQYANEIFESVPVPNLALIHRYRPFTPRIKTLPENGDVQNYNCHFGSALHTKNYVDFYIREGLQTGNREKSARLQRLRQKKKTDDKKANEASKRTETKSASRDRRRPKSTRETEEERKSSRSSYKKSSFSSYAEVESYSDDDGRSRDCVSWATDNPSSSGSTTPDPRSTTTASEVDGTNDADSDQYSSDFQPEVDESRTSASPDTTSTLTYLSTEHARRDRSGSNIEY